MIPVRVLAEEILLASLAGLLESSFVCLCRGSGAGLDDLLGEDLRGDRGKRSNAAFEVVSAVEVLVP